MTKELEFNEYVRKPFVVEACEVTEDNISEVAKYVGELKAKDDGTPFIFVDRKLVPNIYRVFPGFFMTRMGDNIRCYSRRVFLEQFVGMTPHIQEWVDFMNNSSVATSASDSEGTIEGSVEVSDTGVTLQVEFPQDYVSSRQVSDEFVADV